jgi:tRNA threonylcarbamoyladenosine biosynthesis protein TsaE
MKTHELIYTIDTINSVADDLREIMPLVSVFTFTGTLGAGKTTLIQALLESCGVEDTVQSPTFTYLSTYTNVQDQTFYHFDLYRLKSMNEFIQAGFEEYLYQPKSWAFIEWPEIIRSLIKRRSCHIVIEYYGEDRRRLTYTICE